MFKAGMKPAVDWGGLKCGNSPGAEEEALRFGLKGTAENFRR
jgi:hypothetical protein